LICIANQLTSLDLSNNPALEFLACGNNQLTSLDVSNNPSLKYLECGNDTTSFPFQNTLISLDLRNGNNTTFIGIISTNNPNLYCIDVDNANWSTTNWIGVNFNFDPQHYFSNNCSGTAIEEHTTHRELLRTIDVLGRETKNQPLFYIYNDGTVEKRIIIE
jgi:hypothetical protein